MSEDPEDVIDRLIDETARDLTTGTPSSALRSRVNARIVSGARIGWTPRTIWQPALATAAVAVVALVLLRPSPEPETTAPVSSSPTGRVETVESPQVAAIEFAPPQVEQPQAPRMAAQSGRMVAQNNRVGTPADPLQTIEPIAIEPMAGIEFAVVERIPEPMPLRIDQLRVEPLVFQ
jgi:hypothetical protein